MQSFKPYTVLEDSSVKLHLQEAVWRKNVLFFFTHVFPFILIAFTVVLVVVVANSFNTTFLLPLIITNTALAVLLLTRKNIVEIEVTHFAIQLTKQTISGIKEENILVLDIENIRLRKHRGKQRGLFYYLIIKGTGKRVLLLSIPSLYTSNEKKDFISKKLSMLTGVSVIDK